MVEQYFLLAYLLVASSLSAHKLVTDSDWGYSQTRTTMVITTAITLIVYSALWISLFRLGALPFK
jgi:hypothetical protein